MTLLNLTRAIDIALGFLEAKKLCYAAEDADAYYLTACGDNGEPYNCPACCRVDKKTGQARMCYHDDPAWGIEKKELRFPKDRLGIYIPLDKVLGLE